MIMSTAKLKYRAAILEFPCLTPQIFLCTNSTIPVNQEHHRC